jgi:1-acyl-sn-glycerol-3-phosphate acyltransferase
MNEAACNPFGAEPAPPRRWIKFPLALVGHGGYLLTLTVLLVIGPVVILPLMPFPRPRRRVANGLLRHFLGGFAQRFLPAVQACRIVECTGLEHVRQGGPFVIVANHRSSIDAILLLGLLPPAGLVIKARHARKPGYACLVRFFDFVRMDTGAPAALRQSMDKCRSVLNAGMSLLIFPEGLRTSASRLMPFAPVAFRLAIEQGVPVVPVVIHSDRPFLNRQPGSYFPPELVRFRIRVLPPLATTGERDPSRLADTAARQMAGLLEAWDRQYLKSETPDPSSA